MRILFALLAMMSWSLAVYFLMDFIGFPDAYQPTRDLGTVLWGLLAAVILLVGVVGNVWIFLAIVKEHFWMWGENKDD